MDKLGLKLIVIEDRNSTNSNIYLFSYSNMLQYMTRNWVFGAHILHNLKFNWKGRRQYANYNNSNPAKRKYWNKNAWNCQSYIRRYDCYP